MSHVLHLMRHDLRRHWRLLVPWTVLVLAQPVLATVLTTPSGLLGETASLALLVIAARLTLAAVLATRIVQEDAPWSDRAFWRTRPIAPTTMAAGKLVACAVWLLLLPALVVLVVALLADVPAGRLPAVLRQVLAIDGALLGLVLVAAAATRHVSTALLSSLLGVFLAILTFSVAAKATTRSFDHTGQALVGADPFTAFPTLMVVCAVATWTIAALAFGGPRRRTAMLSATAIGALALLAVWYLPLARIHQREPQPPAAAVTLRLSEADVQAVPLPGGERVALVTTFSTTGAPSEDVEGLWQTGGRLHDGTRVLPTRGTSDPTMAPRIGGELRHALLALMDRPQLDALAGRRIRFRGRFALEARQGRVLDSTSLGPRMRLNAPTGAFRGEATPDAPVSLAVGSLTTVTDAPIAGSALSFFLRDAATRDRVGPLLVWHARSSLSFMLLLPTLAHPFTWDNVEFRLAGESPSTFDRHHAQLEMRESTRSVRLECDADLEFEMPGAPAPLGTTGARP